MNDREAGGAGALGVSALKPGVTDLSTNWVLDLSVGVFAVFAK